MTKIIITTMVYFIVIFLGVFTYLQIRNLGYFGLADIFMVMWGILILDVLFTNVASSLGLIPGG